METPVLSKKQQKKALLSKKGPKETIKTVLANPYTTYFPVINETDTETLQALLCSLPRLKPEKCTVPWKLIKDVPKQERKQFREDHTGKITINESIRSNLIYGINNVASLLENGEASAVLISEDVNPRFMVKHIVDLAVLKTTPVLVLTGLRDVLKTTTGIGGMTVAIKSPSDPTLKSIYEAAKAISIRYPVPKKHMHYNLAEVESNASLDETLQNLELETDDQLELPAEELYLYREDAGVRVFVPELSGKAEVSSWKMDVDESGFLAFSDGQKIKEVVKGVNSYRGLKVKRVRNNKSRKRKLKSHK